MALNNKGSILAILIGLTQGILEVNFLDLYE